MPPTESYGILNSPSYSKFGRQCRSENMILLLQEVLEMLENE
jgi:hypothetical protein